MFEKACAFHELDWRYVAFEVEPADLANAVLGLKALGFHGAQCADPHKRAVLPLLDRVTETASAIGVVNLILRQERELVGENTEGRGVVETIGSATTLKGKHVVLLGAGGAARAVAIELAAAGIAALTIVNRNEQRAAELLALLAGKFDGPLSAVAWQGDFAVASEADVLIHATPLGHRSNSTSLPLDLNSLRPELLVADVQIGAPTTWLLHQAVQHGCKTVDGLSMFIHQAALNFQLWTGVDADRQVLREAVEEFWEL
jgi:shikimate dehydrogenase